MNPFPFPLIVENLANGEKDHIRLVKVFAYNWKGYGGYEPEQIIVPPGFLYDNESFPRITQGVFDAENQGAKAATIHDWVYQIEKYPRHICDRIYLEALKDSKMEIVLRYIRYYGVRVGGGKFWPHNSEKIDANLKLLTDFRKSSEFPDLLKQ